MRKFPIYQQYNEHDCGIACIRMMLAYYGLNYSYNKLCEICELSGQGLSLYDISSCFNKVHFLSKVVTISLENLRKIVSPIIVYWKESHYVVIYKIDNSIVYIADPAYGKVKIRIDEFKRYVTDINKIISILVTPEDEYQSDISQCDEEKEVNALYLYWKLLLNNHKIKFIFAIVLLLFASICNWFIPVLLQLVIDRGVLLENFDAVKLLFLFQFVVYMGFLSSNIFSRIFVQKINFNISVNLLSVYLNKLLRIPLRLFDLNLKTDYIQRLEDQTTIQNYSTNQLIDSILNVLNILIFTTILFLYSKFSFCVCIMLSLVSTMWIKLLWKQRKLFNYQRFYLSSENQNGILEIINGMKDIRINNAQDLKIFNWKYLQDSLNKIALKNIYINNYQNFGSSIINIFRDLSINVYAAYSVINHEMTMGEMMGISFIIGNLGISINQLINNTSLLQDVFMASDRLSNILSQKNTYDDKRKYKIRVLKKGIEFSSVSFKYQNKDDKFILKDINAYIPAGKITAIVGASGCGKTTFIKLLLSLYIPQQGLIRIDSEDLVEIDLRSWFKLCGVVLQDGFIFSGNFTENIALGDASPDMERVEYAAKLACIYNYITDLPLGFKTKIGASGLELSLGQKQRILIARAIYKNPLLLILDEATSSLDAKNERAIFENLAQLAENRTVIIVAHRLSTIKKADQIIVLDDGVIVEVGNHDELISKQGNYYELVKNQIN